MRAAPADSLALEEGAFDFAAAAALVVLTAVLAAVLPVFAVLAPKAVCDPEEDFGLEAAVFFDEAPALVLFFSDALGLLTTDVLASSRYAMLPTFRSFLAVLFFKVLPSALTGFSAAELIES